MTKTREMRHVFSNDGWIIDVTKMDELTEWTLNVKRGTRNKNTKRKSNYYCPKGHVNTALMCHDMGAEM